VLPRRVLGGSHTAPRRPSRGIRVHSARPIGHQQRRRHHIQPLGTRGASDSELAVLARALARLITSPTNRLSLHLVNLGHKRAIPLQPRCHGPPVSAVYDREGGTFERSASAHPVGMADSTEPGVNGPPGPWGILRSIPATVLLTPRSLDPQNYLQVARAAAAPKRPDPTEHDWSMRPTYTRRLHDAK
jgi:hypothetical protein